MAASLASLSCLGWSWWCAIFGWIGRQSQPELNYKPALAPMRMPSMHHKQP
jgi:hypothetical protein